MFKFDIAGVYLITNKLTGRVYVGSSAYLKHRINTHKRKLKFGHPNYKLRKEVSKYGYKSFQFSILKIVKQPTAEVLIYWEQHYIDKYKSHKDKFGYNICPIAGSILGIKRSPSSIEKQKITRKLNNYRHSKQTRKRLSIIGKNLKRDWKANGLKISKSLMINRSKLGVILIVLDPDGNKIKICNMIKFCEHHTNLKPKVFKMMLKRNGKYKGYTLIKKIK